MVPAPDIENSFQKELRWMGMKTNVQTTRKTKHMSHFDILLKDKGQNLKKLKIYVKKKVLGQFLQSFFLLKNIFQFFFSDIDENQQEQNSKNKNFAKISKIAKKCKVPPIIFSHIHVYVWQFNLMKAAASDKNKVYDLQILNMQYLVRICFGFWILFAFRILSILDVI
jgi:hypothetical protein